MALFKINPASMFSTIIADATTATAISNKATGYVVVAQQIGNAWGLTGPQKLAAVKAMLLADLEQSWPAGAEWVSKEWAAVAGVISALVSIFNTIGWMFQAAAPIVAAADPEAIPALAAINAAIDASKALQAAAGIPSQTSVPQTGAGIPSQTSVPQTDAGNGPGQ